MPNGEIRRESGCIDYNEQQNKLIVLSCHGHGGHQKWDFHQVITAYITLSVKLEVVWVRFCHNLELS